MVSLFLKNKSNNSQQEKTDKDYENKNILISNLYKKRL